MRKAQNIIIWAAVLAAVVLLNILAASFSGRLDLTYDRRFTLSPATMTVLSRLEDPVTIKAYFTEDLPAPYNTTGEYVKDLLGEYYAAAGGKVRYQFIDPAQVMDAEDEEAMQDVQHDLFGRPVRALTKLEQELQTKGIPPVRIRVNENDKLEERRAYLGLELIYGENSETIPVVQDVGKLEYNITSLVRKMTRPAAPKVAFIGGHQGPDGQNGLAKIYTAVSQQYEIVDLDLGKEEAIADDIRLLAVVGPRTALTEAEQKTIDKFLISGKGVAFLLDSYEVEMDQFVPQKVEHGLLPLLNAYGLAIEPGIVGDAQGASIGIQQRQGFLIVNQPVKYYYMPLVMRYPAESVISSGLGPVAMAFASPLKVTDDKLQVMTIATSSSQSWRENGELLDLNPMQEWNNKNIEFSKEPIPLALAVSGQFNSPFGAGSGNSRLALFGNSYFVDDQFLQESGATMLLNTFDWLNGDDELLAMRGRGLAFALLDENIPLVLRNAIKYANIFGGPVMLVLIGLIIWRRLEQKRRRL